MLAAGLQNGQKKKPDVLSPSHQAFSVMVADFLSPTTKLKKNFRKIFEYSPIF